MTKMKAHHGTNGGHISKDMAGELETVKDNLHQLVSDVGDLVESAAGAGKVGVNSAISGVKNRLSHLRDQGMEQVEAIESEIGKHPIRSGLIFFGLGYIVAKLMSRR